MFTSRMVSVAPFNNLFLSPFFVVLLYPGLPALAIEFVDVASPTPSSPCPSLSSSENTLPSVPLPPRQWYIDFCVRWNEMPAESPTSSGWSKKTITRRKERYSQGSGGPNAGTRSKLYRVLQPGQFWGKNWEEFGEASLSASKRFWQTVRCLRREKKCSAKWRRGGLTSLTEDIVRRWK